MDDCTQKAMLSCMHELGITGCWTNSYRETDLNAKKKKKKKKKKRKKKCKKVSKLGHIGQG